MKFLTEIILQQQKQQLFVNNVVFFLINCGENVLYTKET